MRTNKEKWDHYVNLINERTQAFIKSELGDNLPTVIYEVGYGGKVIECTVRYLDYAHQLNGRSFQLYFFGKNPSKDDIQKMKNFYELNIPYEREKILVYWQGYTSSSAFYYYDPARNKNLFESKSEAEIVGKKIADKKEEESKFRSLHKKDKTYDYASNGYKYLGWQNGWRHVHFDKDGNQTTDPNRKVSWGYIKEDHPEFCKCKELGHYLIEVSHSPRGSENVVSCPICKIYYKYDSSD